MFMVDNILSRIIIIDVENLYKYVFSTYVYYVPIIPLQKEQGRTFTAGLRISHNYYAESTTCVLQG